MAKDDQDDTPNPGPQHTKYFADQFDDEEVLYVFRKHPIVMRKGIVWWGLGMLAGPLYVLALTVLYRNDPAKFPSTGMFFAYMIGSVVLSLILIAPSFISWWFSVFIVTNQRFIQITQKGLFHRSVADVGLEHIQSVNYEVAGLNATLLGFGTMKVQTYIGDILIHELHHPAKIQKRIIGILRDQEIVNLQHAVQATQANHRIIDEED
jgi:uncharacterized membrane protein YdbT with pleckstrin-like domain